jgi:hypothetical protein
MKQSKRNAFSLGADTGSEVHPGLLFSPSEVGALVSRFTEELGHEPIAFAGAASNYD